MLKVKLPKGDWWYDDQDGLGPPGGFGAVFRGRSEGDEPVAVKRLESQYQTREMRIADFLLGHGLAHVIPILDAGFDEDAGTNFIVMPIATTSLRHRIEESGPASEAEAVEILASIAAGLEEIGDIIHRDLKPGNVLLHEGVWKLADLGLARFAEAATSQNTMRGSLTPQYAAPEQWRDERPTKVTDVYALGCIMYALRRGAPPFAGPDYSHQHQTEAPPGLEASAHLKRLAAACLYKAPELRPSIPNVRKQLQTALAAAKGGRVRNLASVAAAVNEKALREEQERLQRERSDRNRRQLAAEAVQVLAGIFQELEAAVLADAPNAELGTGRYNSELKLLSLGDAKLEYGALFPWIKDSSYGIESRNGWKVGSKAWDVLAGGYIAVRTYWSPDRGCSANLWFGRLLEGDDYRWWEVSYVNHGPSISDTDVQREILMRESDLQPFGKDKLYDGGMFDLVATDPLPITPEFVDDFLDRWIERFSQIAAVGHSGAAALFPRPFKRQIVAPKFRLDKP